MTISKHAGWKDNLKAFAKSPYTQAAAFPIIGAGIDAAVGQVRGMVSARKKTEAFKSMMDEQPALKKYPTKRVHRYFNTLHKANPELARDPLVAGNWVATQIGQEMPGTPHTGVVEGVRQVAQIRQMGRDPGAGRPGTFAGIGRDLGKTIPDVHKARLEDRKQEFGKAKDEAFGKLDAYKNDLARREAALAAREKHALDLAARLTG